MSRQRDVLELLADVRPRQLDPDGEGPRDSRQLAKIIAQSRDASVAGGAGAAAGAPRLRRRSFSLVWLTAGAAAASLAAVVAVQTPSHPGATGGVSSAGGTRAAGGASPVSARNILLAAAEKTETGPTSGRYWVSSTEQGVLQLSGSDTNHYVVRVRSKSECWIGQSASLDSWWISQLLGVAPATAEDETAWRADGSPTQFQLYTSKSGTTYKRPISGAGNTPFGNKINTGGSVFAIGDHNVSLADLKRIPTDPAALRSYLLQYFNGGGGDLPTNRDDWLFTVASGIIRDMPVSAAVRSAAYRMLSDLPSVTSLGEVKDASGRSGVAVAIERDWQRNGTAEERLIIDPATGQMLATEDRVIKPAGDLTWVPAGALYVYVLAAPVRFTDDNPPVVREPGGPEPAKS